MIQFPNLLFSGKQWLFYIHSSLCGNWGWKTHLACKDFLSNNSNISIILFHNILVNMELSLESELIVLSSNYSKYLGISVSVVLNFSVTSDLVLGAEFRNLCFK